MKGPVKLTLLVDDENKDEPDLKILKIDEIENSYIPFTISPADHNWKAMNERANLGLRSNRTAWQDIKRGLYRLWKGI